MRSGSWSARRRKGGELSVRGLIQHCILREFSWLKLSQEHRNCLCLARLRLSPPQLQVQPAAVAPCNMVLCMVSCMEYAQRITAECRDWRKTPSVSPSPSWVKKLKGLFAYNWFSICDISNMKMVEFGPVITQGLDRAWHCGPDSGGFGRY